MKGYPLAAVKRLTSGRTFYSGFFHVMSNHFADSTALGYLLHGKMNSITNDFAGLQDVAH
ncbi:hypothetical protein FHS14_006379 [Paenibacillus baekrokdamisoli]|nr:hypothetical protein [Paenibacillus baekrokdamisoli]